MNNNVIWKFTSLSPFILLCSAVIVLCFTRKKSAGIFVFGLILCEFLNHMFKIIFRKISTTKVMMRPDPVKCDTFKDTSDDDYGFPSGHAQIFGFFVGFIIMLVWYHRNWQKYIIILLVLCWSILVCVGRIKIGCHNIFQVLSGFIIGILLGLLIYGLSSKYFIKNK